MDYYLLTCTTSPIIIILFFVGTVVANFSGCNINKKIVVIINTLITAMTFMIPVIFIIFTDIVAEQKVLYLVAIPFFLVNSFLTVAFYGINIYIEKKFKK